MHVIRLASFLFKNNQLFEKTFLDSKFWIEVEYIGNA